MVRALLAKVRNDFSLSAAEVGDYDLLNSCEIGICSVGSDSRKLEGIAEKCRLRLESKLPIEFFHEVLSVESY